LVANGTRPVIAFAATISVNNNTLIQSELHLHDLLCVLSCLEGNAQPYLSHPGYLTSKGFVLSGNYREILLHLQEILILLEIFSKRFGIK
jgi:hypothetical protein